MVGRDGIEPSTNGLKVHCSTAELTARTRYPARLPETSGRFDPGCALRGTATPAARSPVNWRWAIVGSPSEPCIVTGVAVLSPSGAASLRCGAR